MINNSKTTDVFFIFVIVIVISVHVKQVFRVCRSVTSMFLSDVTNSEYYPCFIESSGPRLFCFIDNLIMCSLDLLEVSIKIC